ncbi:hypothetical protein [Actinomadura sp. CNU-125]|uniref:hypothetical protein n=1 Tax=Actinomadura sp. CNU-125 TaxID=1904961 RepID=UPI0009F81B6E|nr:hypothetical protein [Actinomadura sp. CNU-125]
MCAAPRSSASGGRRSSVPSSSWNPRRGRAAGSAARIRADALALAARRPGTAAIRHVLFHYRFPVDVRHDTKIRRGELAVWAAHRLHRYPR